MALTSNGIPNKNNLIVTTKQITSQMFLGNYVAVETDEKFLLNWLNFVN